MPLFRPFPVPHLTHKPLQSPTQGNWCPALHFAPYSYSALPTWPHLCQYFWRPEYSAACPDGFVAVAAFGRIFDYFRNSLHSFDSLNFKTLSALTYTTLLAVTVHGWQWPCAAGSDRARLAMTVHGWQWPCAALNDRAWLAMTVLG